MEKFQYLIRIREAFGSRDSFKLRKIADDAIRDAVLAYDPELADIAVLAYSLSKILSKLHFRKREEWKKFEREVKRELASFVGLSKKGEIRDICERLISLVDEIDKSAGNYTKRLVSKARIKMASTAYALGISLEAARELTGADKYELMRYIGGTKIHERPYTTTISPAKRYEIIRRVLRVKH